MPKFYFLTSKYQNSENESPIRAGLRPWIRYFSDFGRNFWSQSQEALDYSVIGGYQLGTRFG